MDKIIEKQLVPASKEFIGRDLWVYYKNHNRMLNVICTIKEAVFVGYYTDTFYLIISWKVPNIYQLTCSLRPDFSSC